MAKRIITNRQGHKRTNIVVFRMSDHEKSIVVARQSRSKAKTVSAYLRALVVAGREPKIPSYKELIELRNEMVNLTNEIRNARSSRARDRALDKATDAFDRISRF